MAEIKKELKDNGEVRAYTLKAFIEKISPTLSPDSRRDYLAAFEKDKGGRAPASHFIEWAKDMQYETHGKCTKGDSERIYREIFS